jgi:hypothetical protein
MSAAGASPGCDVGLVSLMFFVCGLAHSTR